MINAMHLLIYSDDATATRAFFKDVLQFPFSGQSDDPNDWLIFNAGPSELGVHPTSGEHEGTAWTTSRHHEISFMCDDLEATMKEIAERGATFTGEVEDRGFGRGVLVNVPGADDVLLYQPSYPTAF